MHFQRYGAITSVHGQAPSDVLYTASRKRNHKTAAETGVIRTFLDRDKPAVAINVEW